MLAHIQVKDLALFLLTAVVWARQTYLSRQSQTRDRILPVAKSSLLNVLLWAVVKKEKKQKYPSTASALQSCFGERLLS